MARPVRQPESTDVPDLNVLIKDDSAKTPGSLKWQRDRDRQLVEGIFRYHECPGGYMEFPYKAYKEDPVEIFRMVDGEIKKIPLGVARHLNKNGWYPIHEHSLDADGRPVARVGSKKRRFSFQSLEFVDIEDMMPDKEIVTVEKIY